MYATVNLPGSSYFKSFGPATKAECQDWLAETKRDYQERFGGTWYGNYAPGRVISNREAKKIKYLEIIFNQEL